MHELHFNFKNFIQISAFHDASLFVDIVDFWATFKAYNCCYRVQGLLLLVQSLKQSLVNNVHHVILPLNGNQCSGSTASTSETGGRDESIVFSLYSLVILVPAHTR